jgi:protein involved in polysaccharide export with SLBB domain/Mrp family chromosome partitioning ATPase
LRNERLGLAKELDAVSGAQAQLLAALPSSATNSVRQAELEARFTVLSKERVSLATALQELDLAPATATGRFALSGPPRLERPGLGPPARGPAAAAAGGAAGLLVALGLVLLLDLGRGRIYTAEDLQHASGLPVLGVLRPLEEMDPAAVERWAFQTFTRLKGRLTRSNDEALICGVISASSGEGRSTVARLLTEAASRQGYRVMSIAADPARDDHPGSPVASPGSDEPVGTSLLPAEISRAVASPEHAPGGVMRLPALGLTLDLRAQWREALERARNADRLVLVADLPPASSQNGVLLAESLPNLLWVAGQGAARLAETRAGVSLLEDSRCNLIGAIMNTIPKHVRKRPAWRPWGAGALALWLVQPSLQAQDTGSGPPAPAAPSLASPAATVPTTKTPKLAPWQERLALGPGDVMDISLYGQSDSLRNGLFIGPDGRLNYLEARDVEAVGLTVDELREKLEAILGKYHRTPRVVINPLAFNSKKYFILGNVQSVGPFPLNRPVTILEAVARAGGFVTSAHYRNVIVQADLGRSFLARTDASGAPTRVPVDFEAVLLRGDLSQNLTLNPGDYLYFPPIDVQEVYVLGAVNSPGVVPYTQEMTAIAAIVSRGSFAEKAYRGKILVCRGSLNAPQVFTVDANAILSARQRDFPLQNKDIVYVARRPFAKVEELTEQAITSFVHGLIWGFTQTRVIPQLPQP